MTMSQRYTHLTLEERYQIKASRKAGFSNKEIAFEKELRALNEWEEKPFIDEKPIKKRILFSSSSLGWYFNRTQRQGNAIIFLRNNFNPAPT